MVDWVDSIAVGDFDEDGRIDIVTSGADGVVVRTSAGDDWRRPAWSEGTVLLADARAQWAEQDTVAAADLDADGHLDVVAAAADLGVRFFFGAGDGTFEQNRPSLNDDFEAIYQVTLADVDARDVPQLVLATSS